jgi:hypothetical protein
MNHITIKFKEKYMREREMSKGERALIFVLARKEMNKPKD